MLEGQIVNRTARVVTVSGQQNGQSVALPLRAYSSVFTSFSSVTPATVSLAQSGVIAVTGALAQRGWPLPRQGSQFERVSIILKPTNKL